MKNSFRKSLSMILVLILALGINAGIVALASQPSGWESFQSDYTNNGTINNGTPPTASTTTATTVTLPTSGTIGTDVYSGVDTTSVISGGVAYTVYNGGISSGYNGGARLHATTLSTAATAFDIRLDANANNVQQLSTPYLDGTTLYAATTFYTNQLATSGVTDWVDANDDPITAFDFPANTNTIITYNGLVVPSDFWAPQLATDVNTTASGFTGDVTLRSTTGGENIDFGTASYFGGDWTLYNNSGDIVPADTYNVMFSVNNTSNTDITATSIQFLTSGWNLWSVDVGSPGTPLPVLLKTGYGQSNTPISYGTTTIDEEEVLFIYWGVYEGDRSYYQYDTTSGATAIFNPTNISYPADDFYGAGAVVVTVSGNDYAVFGGDGGYIYICPVTAFNTSANNIQIDGTPHIRSSVAVDSTKTNVYFTGQNASLWQIPISTIISAPAPVAVDLSAAITGATSSTSTPVISANGYIYAGVYGYDSEFNGIGGVLAVAVNGFSSNAPVIIYDGDPVQSSPIVYSVTAPPAQRADYVYFTTNANHSGDSPPVANHNGYCYKVGLTNLSSPVPSLAWNPSNPAGVIGTYALQGFASDGGYIIYGDDSNTLYIFN